MCEDGFSPVHGHVILDHGAMIQWQLWRLKNGLNRCDDLRAQREAMNRE